MEHLWEASEIPLIMRKYLKCFVSFAEICHSRQIACKRKPFTVMYNGPDYQSMSEKRWRKLTLGHLKSNSICSDVCLRSC